ncbi:hypothetical protein [Roseimicrobium sp. ORNL1]|uniref:hypothetical protein n=1 Tax=Roseimicrobium sp. ORNL1 TaxID=2711231 RepID=UPI0013E18E90|nr:hypothetical protein [Roseimicrobium sp. ORNL1]QIF04639.1 hypothetical protein G5S37_24955 [Roseimicrobium sp. ORNL1]
MEIFTGLFGFVLVVVGTLIAIAGLLMPLVVWQMDARLKAIEDRAYAMRKMMRLCEDHLRMMRVMQTGEQLEPRDPTL